VATRTGYTYISGTRQTGWQLQFQQQIWVFWPLPVHRNWPRRLQQRPRTYWKLQYGRFARRSRNFWHAVVVAMIWLIICWAGQHRQSRMWRGNLDAVCHSSRDVIISGLGPYRHFRLSVTVVLTYQHYFKPVHGLIPQCCWNRTVCSLKDISISGFGRRFYCSSLLQSPGYTSCEFAMVECRRFAVGIFMIYVIVLELLLLPVTSLPCWTLDTK